MSLTISAAQVSDLISNPSSISGYSASGPIIITGAITYTQANSLNAVDATYIQATISETTVANLSGIAVNNSSRASLNKFSMVLSDTSATAAELTAVQALTSVSVDATNITAIESSSADDITALFTATTVPTGASADPITVSDTTISATTLNAIDGYTTGAVTATAATTITGPVADILTAMSSAGITDNADVAVTVTDTTVDAADLNDVDGLTSGVVTCSNATTLTGIDTEVEAALTANASVDGDGNKDEIDGLDAVNVTLDDPDTAGTQSYAVEEIRDIIDLTTGVVTATVTETTIAALTATDGTGLHGTSGNALTITVTNDDGTAANLLAIDGYTTETVTVDPTGDTVFTVNESTADDVIALFAASGTSITGLSGSAVTIASTDPITVSEANAINAKTTGVITATISTNGASDLATLVANSGSTANAYTITVGDSVVTAADLNTINGVTSVDVVMTAVATITGSLADVKTFYAAADDFTNEGDELVTITDTTIIADDLATVNAATTGKVTLSGTVTAVTGAASKIHEVLDDSHTGTEIAGLDTDATYTVSGETDTNIITATDLNSINTRVSTVVLIDSSATTLKGDHDDVETSLVQNKTRADANDATGVETPTISGLDGLALTIDDPITQDELEVLQTSYTTGVITASIGSRTMAQLLSETDGVKDIASGDAFSVTLTQTAINAEDLVELNGMTSGLITVVADDGGTDASTITGSLADVKAIMEAKVDSGNGIKDDSVADAIVELDDVGSVSAADLNVVLAATSADVDLNAGVTTITGLIADVNTALGDATLNSNQDGGANTQAVVITDASVTASAVKTLIPDGAQLTSGDITFISSTLTGDFDDIEDIYETGGLIEEHIGDSPGDASNVYGLGSINITISGTSTTAAQARTVSGYTTGIVTATILNTQTMDDLLHSTTGLNEEITTTANNFTITVDDPVIQASELITLAGRTAGTITLDTDTSTEASNSPELQGSIADINTVFAESKISGISASAVTITGGATVSQINALTTTGTITATVSDGDMTTLAGITDTTNALTISVTDASIDSTALVALAAKTTGLVNVSATSSLTGTRENVTTALNATDDISGVGTMAVSVSDTVTVAQANAVHALTSGVVSATISETDLTTLITLDTGNAWTVVVDKQTEEDPDTAGDQLVTTIDAGNLNTLDTLTSEVVTVTAPAITGTLAEMVTAFAANTPADLADRTISGLETKAITIEDEINQTELETAQSYSTGVLTATLATGDILTAGTPGAADVTGVLSAVAADDQVDGDRAGAGGTFNGVSQSATSGSGSGATFNIVVAGDGGLTITLVDRGQGYAVNDTITIANTSLGSAEGVNDLELDVASLQTARPAATYSNVATTTDGGGANATLTVTIDADGVASAIVGNNAGAGYEVGDTLTVLDSALGDQGAAALTFQVGTRGGVSIAEFLDTTTVGTTTTQDIESGNVINVTFDDATIDAEDLVLANSLTDGLITVTSAAGGETTLRGSLTDLVAVYAAEVDSGNGILDTSIAASPITIRELATFGGLLSAADLNTLNDATTGLITVDVDWNADGEGGEETTITGITGSYTDVHDALTADSDDATNGSNPQTITGIEAAGMTVTLTGTVTVAQLNDIVDNYTTGIVTATVSDTDMATLDDLTTTAGAYTVTVADTTVQTDELTVLDGDTTETITVTSSTLLGDFNGGDATDVNTTLDSDGISGLASIGVTSDDATNSVAEVNVVSAKTTGVVTATITETTMDGLAALNETGNAYTITVEDASVDAAALNVLNGKTTVAVTVNATTITGALSDVQTLYAANTAGEITGLGNESITISDTGTISSADLNDLNALTTGVVTVTATTNLSGSLSELLSSYSDSNIAGVITGLSDEALTVTDTGSVSAADLNTLDSKTTGTVTVNPATVTGSYSDIATAYAAAGLSGLGDEAITITGSVTVAEANAVNALTTGVVTATISATDMDSLDDITGTGAYTITVADTSVSAASLTALNAKTTVDVIVSSATVTGTATEIDAAYDATGFTGLASEALSVNSGTASVSEVNTLGAHTTGVVTATVTEGDMTTLAGITETGNALSVTVTDTSVSSSALTALDGKTTVAVDASAVSTLTGTETEQLAAYAAHRDGTITGLDSSFDAASYLASHADLLRSFTKASVKSYFFDFGIAEGRALDTFDESSYLASYTDLLAYFGTDTSSVTTHYVDFGYSEGRSADAFDELGYVASYADLIEYIGVDATTSVSHYINFGYGEGRSVTFDAESYLDANADLKAFIQDDLELAKKHYILHGADEGRLIA